MSYAQVAAVSGSPRGSRAVGTIMKENRDPDVPCHCVIRSDGNAGEYNRGKEVKARRLLEEGAELGSRRQDS